MTIVIQYEYWNFKIKKNSFNIRLSFNDIKVDIVDNNEAWYRQIIKYEIEPLLKEYWFDDIERAEQEVDNLIS